MADPSRVEERDGTLVVVTPCDCRSEVVLDRAQARASRWHACLGCERRWLLIDPQRGQVTLAEWVTEWWPMVLSLSTSSRVRLKGIIDRHVSPRFGSVQLARITQPSVALWVADLQKLGLSPASVQKCHRALTRILSGAVRAELIRRNVAAEVELPVVRSQEMRFLTAEEVEDLAAAHPERYRALVLVAAYGGFRFGELAGLRRRRIDLAGNVRVEETCVEVAGDLVWEASKTKAGRRSVTLPSFVASALRDHQAKYSQSGPDGLVFTAPAGGPLRRSNYRHKVWLPALEKPAWRDCVFTICGIPRSRYGLRLARMSWR